MVDEYIEKVKANGCFEERRHSQHKYWMYESLEEQLKMRFYNAVGMDNVLSHYEQLLLTGKITSFAAAAKVMEYFDSLRDGANG